MNMHARFDADQAETERMWCIARFMPNRVEAFRDLLDDHKVDYMLPLEQVTVRCGFNKTRTRERPLLGPYAFVDADQIVHAYRRLKEFSVFHGLMMRGDGFAMEYDWKVEALRLLHAKLAGTLSTDDFMAKIGDLVRFRAEKHTRLPSGAKIIEAAAFGGLVVRIKDIRYTDRIRYCVELDLFGGKIPTWVDADEFEPA